MILLLDLREAVENGYQTDSGRLHRWPKFRRFIDQLWRFGRRVFAHFVLQLYSSYDVDIFARSCVTNSITFVWHFIGDLPPIFAPFVIQFNADELFLVRICCSFRLLRAWVGRGFDAGASVDVDLSVVRDQRLFVVVRVVLRGRRRGLKYDWKRECAKYMVPYRDYQRHGQAGHASAIAA